MNSNLIQHGDPNRLTALLGWAVCDSPRWLPKDFADILAHQLSAPLVFDLTCVRRDLTDSLRDEPAIRSFGELLNHPEPPLVLLKMTKDFAKTSDGPSAPMLPPEVASVLYFAAIIVALQRLRERITAMDDRTLSEGVRWALAQTWIDARTRALFESAEGLLGSDWTAP